MDLYIVYKHINKINGKIYIGITKYQDNPNKRWRNGFGYCQNQKFFYDIVKFGWDNFDHIVLERNLSEIDALIKERDYIKYYNSVNEGYNNASSGTMPSPEGKEKIKKALTGLKRNQASIDKQLQTKKDRYGSGRGEKYLGSQAKKVKCNETNDVFASIQEACRWCNSSKVGNCCRGERAHAGTHPITGQKLSWSYVDSNSKITINCEENLKPKKNIQKVQCVETKKIYNNATEAYKDTGIATCNILRVCKGERKTAGKMHWIFIKEE